jgi:quinol monooxygenase YgiN
VILERVEIEVKAGEVDRFIEMMECHGLNELRKAEGCLSLRMGRCFENPALFLALVEWDSVASHEAFLKTPEIEAFRALITPFFASAPRVEHFVFD